MTIKGNPQLRTVGAAVLAAASLGLAVSSYAQAPHKAGGVFSYAGQRPTFQEGDIKNIEIIVSNDQSEGRMSLIGSDWLPSFTASPHYHKDHAETFYIVSGAVEWSIGGESHIMRAGDLVHIPSYTAHAVKVMDGKPAHMLMFYMPGGYEDEGTLSAALTEEQRKEPKIAAVLTNLTDFNRLKSVTASPAIPEGQPPKAVPVFSFHGKRPTFTEGGVSDIETDLSSAQTEGRLSIIESKWLPSFSAPPHFHKTHSETFYLFSGHMEWTIDGQTHVIGPGDAVHIPPNNLHSVKVVGDEPAHVLWIGAPGGLDENAEAASDLSAEQRKDPAIQRLLNVVGDFHTPGN